MNKMVLTSYTILCLLSTVFLIGLALTIKTVKANDTIYIRADGSVEGTDEIQRDGNIYTFTDDISDEVVVERSNIVIDGKGYTLQGNGSGEGFRLSNIGYIGLNNITIKNTSIIAFYCGVSLGFTTNSVLFKNNITNNDYGVSLFCSSHNTISGNNITNNGLGIELWGVDVGSFSDNNIIHGNNITNNHNGIHLSNCFNNTLSGNMFNNNSYNFYVSGHEFRGFMHSIDVSNLVDGKPVYYLVNQTDLVITDATHPKIGYMALANCANVTIEGVTLTSNMRGLLLAYVKNSKIAENDITNNYDGIYLYDSSNNSISGNNITNNEWGINIHSDSSNNTFSENNITNHYNGIFIQNSYTNTFSANTLNDNSYNFYVSGHEFRGFMHSIDVSNLVDGKPVYYLVNQTDLVITPITYPELGFLAVINSANVTIEGMTLTKNRHGLLLAYINNSRITNNTITDNSHGVYLAWSLNTILSGNNITASNGFGVNLDYSCNNTISGNSIIDNRLSGVWLEWSSNNTISRNDIAKNDRGVQVSSSSHNTICGNDIAKNDDFGIHLSESSNNSISENNIINNDYGITFYNSSDNIIFHNNFITNAQQVSIHTLYTNPNFWDNGLEGNYWSNYTGLDLNHDGIGNTWHQIDANNTDNYPLMGIFSGFNTSLGRQVNVISNSTIEGFEYFDLNNTIRMYVSNMMTGQTFGFCRICIPHTLMNPDQISVIIDDGQTPILYHNFTLYDNDTHRWIYFAYEHSTHVIDIIPEFSSLLILPLFMIGTLLTVILYRRKHTK